MPRASSLEKGGARGRELRGMWMGGTHRGAAAAVRRFWIGDYRSILWLTSYRWDVIERDDGWMEDG